MKINKKAKIAITSTSGDNIFGNGLGQNIWFLHRMLKDIGYDVELVSESSDIASKKFLNEEIKHLTPESVKQYNLVLEVANPLNEAVHISLKNSGGVNVLIQYGNKLLIDMEWMLRNETKHSPIKERTIDEMWCSPHYEFSAPALSILNDTEVKICPYIWSPEIVTWSYMSSGVNPFFSEKTNINDIAIMESNLHVVKMAAIPMIICDGVYKKRPDLINTVYVFGSLILKDSSHFTNFASRLQLKKDKKMFFEHRYALNFILSKGYGGLIVSHQWENQLNYLQLEAMHYGVPFVHNSTFFKDYGYYYDYFDAKQGVEKTIEAIENHKNVFRGEQERNNEKLWEFNPKNPKNIQGYVELIENILDTKVSFS